MVLVLVLHLRSVVTVLGGKGGQDGGRYHGGLHRAHPKHAQQSAALSSQAHSAQRTAHSAQRTAHSAQRTVQCMSTHNTRMCTTK